jgi:hypothetical protein
MATKKAQRNQKVGLRFDPKTIEVIDRLEIPIDGLPAQVRYLIMRGIETVQAERAARHAK